MNPLLYWSILILSCGYALIRGRADERMVAGVCIAASVISVAVLSPMSVRYTTIEKGEVAVDLIVLAVFLLVALRSDRFWPLWITGLQLTTILAHMLKAVDFRLLPFAYGAAERFWSYPILVIIAVGAWRQHRRQLADSNPARLA